MLQEAVLKDQPPVFLGATSRADMAAGSSATAAIAIRNRGAGFLWLPLILSVMHGADAEFLLEDF